MDVKRNGKENNNNNKCSCESPEAIEEDQCNIFPPHVHYLYTDNMLQSCFISHC